MNKASTFKDCVFNREKIAKTLLFPMLERDDRPNIITINAPWGYGKTTFLNHTSNFLKENENYKVLNFNAWENDFYDDPFIAIVSEIMTDMSADEDVKKSVGNIIKSFVFTSIRVASLINPLVTDAVNKVIDGVEEMVSESGTVVNEYNKLKNDISTFKNYLKEISKDKPIVFIIDELDRCRPTYAITLLERIKHLFDVDNIIFIFGIDRMQLSHSITSIYGIDMDTNGYLKRFFDIEIELPKPDTLKYLRMLIQKHKLEETIPQNVILETLAPLLSGLDFSARDIEKFITRLKYIPLDGNLHLKLFLTAFKMKREDLFKKIVDQKITTVEIITEIKDCLTDTFKITPAYYLLLLDFSFYLGYKNLLSDKGFEEQFTEDIKPELIETYTKQNGMLSLIIDRYNITNREHKNDVFKNNIEIINCLTITRY